MDGLFIGEAGGLDAAGDAVFGAEPEHPARLGIDVPGAAALGCPANLEFGRLECSPVRQGRLPLRKLRPPQDADGSPFESELWPLSYLMLAI